MEKRRACRSQWGSKRPQPRIDTVWQRGMDLWASMRAVGIAWGGVRRQQQAC